MSIRFLHRFYRAMQKRHPSVLFYGNSAHREIALTFDDGPHPRDTPEVLDVLAKHEVRATFFLIGRDVEKNHELVKRIHAGGHEIGIHCYRHIPFPFENSNVLQKQLERTKTLISQACGISPTEIRDIRPPYGAFTSKTKSLLAEWGYRLVMWNCIPPHFTQPLSWTIQQILESSIAGSIIVLHDGHGHGSKAAQIVEIIVPKIKSRGFEFVTVKRMHGMIGK